jgi:uncharacterized protein (TIGR02996 family)
MEHVGMLLDVLSCDPGDDGAWLALADALEEEGDRRGESTRLSLWLRRRPDDAEHSVWERCQRERLEQGVRVCLPRQSIPLGENATLSLALIPPGTFWMGSPPTEEGRQSNETRHRVTLTRGFWLGIHPLTQAQWQAIAGSNPSHFQEANRPVEQVSWQDCQAFCRRLSERTGRRCRLPSEAEWEYACRAGTTTPFAFGEALSTEQANYVGDLSLRQGKRGIYRGQTTTVGSFPANAWGLCDLHGNVWEWCRDWFAPYPDDEVVNPRGEGPSDRVVLRGGSWIYQPVFCRSAYRMASAPTARNDYCGCRVVLE